MQNSAKKDKKRAARANLFFLLIRKKVCCTCNLFFLLIRSIDLDAIFIGPPPPLPFSITRFNFFCLQVLLTRASLLALTKSIYYFRQHGYRNNFHFPFCLYWLLKLSLLRNGWPCDFLPKKPWVFGLPYLLCELFYIGMPMVRTDVLTVTWLQVATKVYGMHR